MSSTLPRRIVACGLRGSLAAMLTAAALVGGAPLAGRAEDGTPAADGSRKDAGGGIEAGGWHTDLTTARALAARTGRPLFVVFRCER